MTIYLAVDGSLRLLSLNSLTLISSILNVLLGSKVGTYLTDILFTNSAVSFVSACGPVEWQLVIKLLLVSDHT